MSSVSERKEQARHGGTIPMFGDGSQAMKQPVQVKGEDAKAIDWNDPIQQARARIDLLADTCQSDIGRIRRAVQRDYQMSREEWDRVIKEMGVHLREYVAAVNAFTRQGSDVAA